MEYYWTLVLSILAGVLAVYHYSRQAVRPSVFQRHGIPQTDHSGVLHRLFQLFLFPKSFPTMIQYMYNIDRQAKYVGILNFSQLIVMIRDVELFKSIGIKNFDSFEDHLFFGNGNQDPLFSNNLLVLRGDRWRNVRALLSPAFTGSKMKAMFHLISECAVNFTEYLRTDVPSKGRVTEMREVLMRYANDVIATCAFGIQVDSMRHPTNEFYVKGKKLINFNKLALVKILLSQHLPMLSRFLNLKIIDARSTEFFTNLVAETIRTRDENGITRPDMLQLMMDDRDNGKRLTIVEMTSQAFLFFLAGFESVSTVMSFAAYEIGVNPDVQEKLQNEIDCVLEETNGQPSYEAINGMKYLGAIVNETLRMYPAQPLTDRLCTKDFELPATLPGAKPYLVKKGDLVWLPFYALHHDAEYFPEPFNFKPERFLDDNRDQCNLNAYYPFGLGPRICIGNRFAQMEIKILLFHLLARCDLESCEKTQIPITFKKGGFSMHSENGCWLNVVPRRQPHSTIAK